MEIDLKKIIEESGLNKKMVATQLFPGQKYPVLALNRIIHGEGLLNTEQLSKLAALAGIRVCDVFDLAKWKGSTKDGVHVFTAGNYRAELDVETWTTKIFHKESLFHTSLLHSPTISLKNYLQSITIQIEFYEKAN